MRRDRGKGEEGMRKGREEEKEKIEGEDSKEKEEQEKKTHSIITETNFRENVDVRHTC